MVHAILTSVATHPTRPELLITGADDGRVCFWDQRRLDSPFRTESKHQRAVRALQVLYSAGDDSNVLAWDFHHGRAQREPVAYDQLPGTAAAAALQVQPVVSDFFAWNALDVHADADLVVAGGDAQSIVLVQNASTLPWTLP